MDDPRLDETFSMLFSFRRGDVVATKRKPSLRGKITDGVYVGELPRHIGDVKATGKTLYELTTSADSRTYVVEESEIEKAEAV